MFTKTMCCFRDQESHFENTQVWMSEAPPSVRIMVARFWNIIPPRTTEKIETARTSENDCRDRPFRFRSWITRTRPLQGRLSVYHTSERKGRYSLLSLCIHSELLKKRLPSLRPGAQKRPGCLQDSPDVLEKLEEFSRWNDDWQQLRTSRMFTESADTPP